MATVPVTTSQKTAVLQPGECIILPQGAVVTSVILDGAISISSSTCLNLPVPSAYKCGYFAIMMDASGNDGAMNETDTYYTSVTIGGNTYMISERVILGTDPGIPNPITALNLHITDLALFEFTAVTHNTSASDRSLVWVYFKAPESLFNSIELKIVDRVSTFYYLKPNEAECDVYDTPV